MLVQKLGELFLLFYFWIPDLSDDWTVPWSVLSSANMLQLLLKYLRLLCRKNLANYQKEQKDKVNEFLMSLFFSCVCFACSFAN